MQKNINRGLLNENLANPEVKRLDYRKRITSISTLAIASVIALFPNPVIAEFIPTLDKIKETENFLQSDHSKFILQSHDQETSEFDEVIINVFDDNENKNLKYIFKPDSSELETVKLLSASGNAFFKEVFDNEDYVFEIEGKKYTIDISKIQNSGYKLTPVDTEGDSGIYVKIYEYNPQTQNFTEKLNRLDLTSTTYGAGEKELYFTFETINLRDPKPSLSATENQSESEITAKYNDYANKIDGANGGVTFNNPSGETNFIENTLYSSIVGSAINNAGILTNIKADFIENHSSADGAAIYNTGNIDNISGVFINSSISARVTCRGTVVPALNINGGAIYNSGTIGNITADFINNNITATVRHSTPKNYNNTTINYSNVKANGAAIYNSGKISNIEGNFIGNSILRYKYFSSSSSERSEILPENTNDPSAIVYNGSGATIGNIKGNFIKNNGYAIVNYSGTIGNIIGDFIGNGGVIYNGSDSGIGSISGDFINSSSHAIYNYGTIGDITGNLIGNTIKLSNLAHGGAIYNADALVNIGNINGDFIGNAAIIQDNRKGTTAYGGAIFNGASSYEGKYASIGSIHGNFYKNYVYNPTTTATDSTLAKGGAIFNRGYIKEIVGDFVSNYAHSVGSTASGGAIENYGKDLIIEKINGNFINNYALASYNAKGGAINTSRGIPTINGNFIGNYAETNRTLDNVNSYANGGALYNNFNSVDINGDFIQNHVSAYVPNLSYATVQALGGAIFNSNPTSEHLMNISGSFIENYAKSVDVAKGGAIYTTGSINFIADNKEIKISGNYVEDKDGKRPEAIYVFANNSIPTLNFNSKNNGRHIIDDQINGARGYNVTFSGDGTGSVELNNDILYEVYSDYDHTQGKYFDREDPVNITLDNTNLHLGTRDNVLDKNYLILNSGTFNMINNQVGISALNSLTLNGDTKFVADVDLENQTMDRFTTDNYTVNNGAKLHVVGLNMISDAPADRKLTEIYFAQQGLKDAVVSEVGDIGAVTNQWQTTAYTPIYKYNVTYDNRDDAGYFLFTKGDSHVEPVVPQDDDDKNKNPQTPTNQDDNNTKGDDNKPSNTNNSGGYKTVNTGNPSDAFNPAVLATSVLTQAAGMSTLNQAFEYAFEHSDGFMSSPHPTRYYQANANKFALSTDYNQNLGNIDFNNNNKAIWVKPYTTFENIPLKNGPKVDAITYGTIIGGDTNIRHLKRGWENVGTLYIGYNGSQLKYDGVDSSTNGGLLGLTETFYKGNFYTAFTATTGAGVAESHTMYGKEDSTFLMAGVASKTGYNFEFKEGKFIIQPQLMMSYSMVKAFDYTNAANVRVKSDAAHNIKISPTLKFITNLENGWQPYASVGMVWDMLHESDVKVNGVKLPEMYTKPYVQYGVGLQRNWNDRYSAFGQAMVRNGGRNGIALTFGFRWAFGKDNNVPELTQTPQKTKTVIKSTKTKVVKTQDSKKVKLVKTTKELKNKKQQASLGQKHIIKALAK